MRFLASMSLLLVLLLGACEDGEADTATSETAGPIDSTSTPATPGAPWVSYAPETAPVGTTVHIEGNVGQAILDADAGPASRIVQIRLLKLDSPNFAYRAGLADIPYADDGAFEGDFVIPEYLSAWQAPADTPPHKVTTGEYKIQIHPVDAGLLVFNVTDN